MSNFCDKLQMFMFTNQAADLHYVLKEGKVKQKYWTILTACVVENLNLIVDCYLYQTCRRM